MGLLLHVSVPRPVTLWNKIVGFCHLGLRRGYILYILSTSWPRSPFPTVLKDQGARVRCGAADVELHAQLSVELVVEGPLGGNVTVPQLACHGGLQSINLHLVSLRLIRGVNRQELKTQYTKHQMFKAFTAELLRNGRSNDIWQEGASSAAPHTLILLYKTKCKQSVIHLLNMCLP